MKFHIENISGNSFVANLEPETPKEKALFRDNNSHKPIARYYENAVKFTLGEALHIASLTPNDNFPYSATIEVFSSAEGSA